MKEWEEVECFREVEITQEIKRTRTKEEKKSERGARPQCMDADEFGSMPPLSVHPSARVRLPVRRRVQCNLGCFIGNG